MKISIKSIIKGLLSYTPLKRIVIRKGTGGTDSARYCYSVWLRHLVLLYENGMKEHPKIIAELGPGDSLGIGLAALITGAKKYYALDVIKHTDLKSNLKILEELVELFNKKADIPDEREFPELKPKLSNYKFPESLVNKLADKTKLDLIRKNLNGLDESLINYIVPWDNFHFPKLDNSIDLIYSQAVMEHILDLQNAYKIMYKWLKKGGFISHQIDYKAHETHKIWNGHWKYIDFLWKIIMHGRSYPINRYPHSFHISLIEDAGFNIKKVLKDERFDGYKINQFSKLRYFIEEDFITASAHIIAEK